MLRSTWLLKKDFLPTKACKAIWVNADFEGTKTGLSTGKYDLALGLFEKWVPPMTQGLNIKFTAGLHTGCIQVIAGNNSGINTLTDLKGKRVGVDAIGAGSMDFLVVALNGTGVDWQKI